MKIKYGDSVIFGKEWCKKYYRRYTGKPVLLTMQIFENDNGLYSYDEGCLGVYNKKEQEADSIYHLFGNNFEHFMDCALIKATPETIAKLDRIERRKWKAQERAWRAEAEYYEKHYMQEQEK